MNKKVSLNRYHFRRLIEPRRRLIPPAKVEDREEDHDDVNIKLHCGVDMLFWGDRVFLTAHDLQNNFISSALQWPLTLSSPGLD